MSTPKKSIQEEPQRFVERKGINEPQHFISTHQAEIEILKARQKLAVTFGTFAVLLVIVVGAIAIFAFQRWSEHQRAMSLAQLPSERTLKEPSGVMQTLVNPNQPPIQSLAQTPVQPQTSPLATVEKKPSPPNLTEPTPTTPSTQQQPPPTDVLDYLEKLRKIEQQRKREEKNFWVAVQALNDLVKAIQNIPLTGDIPEEMPDYDPQKTVQAYEAYQGRFVQLKSWLGQLTPPPSCQKLHLAYEQALQSHISVVETLKQKLIRKDLAGVALFGLGAQGQIDQSLLTADSELEDVCNFYRINKFFTIGN